MTKERMEEGFWAVALCRSPAGWAINLGPWMFYFGSFEQDIKMRPVPPE